VPLKAAQNLEPALVAETNRLLALFARLRGGAAATVVS